MNFAFLLPIAPQMLPSGFVGFQWVKEVSSFHDHSLHQVSTLRIRFYPEDHFSVKSLPVEREVLSINLITVVLCCRIVSGSCLGSV